MQLPHLYTLPVDLFDYLGVEGVQLRVDDHNQATGQTIQLTAAAAQGATAVTIAPLTAPLLAGTVLEFDGSSLAQQTEVILTAVGQVGVTSLSVMPLPYAMAALCYAFDNGTSVALAQRLNKACQYGTSQTKLYLSGRYDDSDLYANATEHGSVNRWATALAAKWLCSRRGQTPPGGVAADAKEALDEMKQVRCNGLQIEDIATRTAAWPFISNITHDPQFLVAQVRVETAISEATPTQYGQRVDYNTLYFLEW
jgi:hypothetical protein